MSQSPLAGAKKATACGRPCDGIVRRWTPILLDLPMNEPIVKSSISSLQKLRINRGLTQQQVAKAMGVTQPKVSQMETRQRRLEFATLVRYIAAMSGVLSVSAVFPDKIYVLQLTDLLES